MPKRLHTGIADVAIPYEPRVIDRSRQAALTARYLSPSLPELEAFFLAVRAHLDSELEPAQPVKLGKTYPLGQCLEISLAAQRYLQRGDLSAVAPSGAPAAGKAAFTAFRKAGGILRPVWGDLRGEFFQNAFQLGSLYLDVSNDTVTRTKPKVEILPFEQARLTPIADYRHFTRLAARYWRHRAYPNHVLPELAPYCPLIHVTPDGQVCIMDSSEYMVGMTQARRFTPSEDVLSDEPMPVELFRYVAQALAGSPWTVARSPEEGRVQALRACREYRRKRWYTALHHGLKPLKTTQEINSGLQQLARVRPYAAPPAPSTTQESTMQTRETITVNGAEYNVADLSDEARRIVDMLRAVDSKIADLQRDQAIHQTARKAYAEALLKALPVTPARNVA